MRLPKTLPVALITAFGVTLLSARAGAVGQPEASPTGKGIVGGTLLGAEAAFLITSAIDPETKWIYLASGMGGAVGGGILGYYVEQTGSAKASMFLLAGGLALVIPTFVAVLSATAYEPPADYTEDQGPADEPVAEPPEPDNLESQEGGADPPRAAPLEGRRIRRDQARVGPYHPLGPALFGAWADGTLALSMPLVELSDVFTPTERHEYGMGQKTELRLALFNFNF